MKYLLTPAASPIKSIEIADDLTRMTFEGDVSEIIKIPLLFTNYYAHGILNNKLTISGLGSAQCAFSSLTELMRNDPSIHTGVYSVRYFLRNLKHRIGKLLYHQILEDVNRLSAALDEKFYFETMQFQDVGLLNPPVLPEEKAIVYSDDVDDFKGRIVAFNTNIPYFSRSNFVSPADPRYRFALINNKQLPRGDCYSKTEFGFTMYCFITSKDNFIDTPLIHTFLKLGQIAMRLATVEELEYLLAAARFNQGFFTLSRSYTKECIQREIAHHKATLTILDDASHAPATDDLVASSSEAASSSSQAPTFELRSAPSLATSPSYMPGYHSRSRSSHHSRSHERRTSRCKRKGRRSR